MLAHEEVWAAIDALAVRNGLSPSGLARRSGLDPTTFNKSKRHAADGRPRWPSTESISKILSATNTNVREFFGLSNPQIDLADGVAIPLVGEAHASAPTAPAIEEDDIVVVPQPARIVTFPDLRYDPLYALSVVSDSMMPFYRHGDVLFVAPKATVSSGDRVAVKLRGNAGIEVRLVEESDDESYTFYGIHPDQAYLQVASGEVEWMARIVYATQ